MTLLMGLAGWASVEKPGRAINRIEPLLPPDQQGQGAVIAYDCNDGSIQYTDLDLTQVKGCPDPKEGYRKPKRNYVQVLQVNREIPVVAQNCRVELTVTTAQCGFDSIAYGVQVFKELEIMPPEVCRQFLTSAVVKYRSVNIAATHGMGRQAVTWFEYGSVRDNGRCEADSFTYGGVSYNSGYKQNSMEITIERIQGTHDPTTGEVHFNNGLIAPAVDRALIDEIKGTMAWDTVEAIDCEEMISGIYAGLAQIYRRTEAHVDPYEGAVVLIEVEKVEKQRFAGLELTGQFMVCNRRCYSTHILDLHLCLLTGSQYATQSAPFRIGFKQEIIESKTQLSYLIISHGLRISERFKTIQQDICNMDRRISTANLREIANKQPGAIMDHWGKGYESYKAGAVAYIAKCQAKVVYVAEFGNCTEELPVSMFKNGSQLMFRDPLTEILRKFPTIIPCSPMMPPKHLIHGKWYCATPQLRLCEAPITLNATVTQFSPLYELGKGLNTGIYTQGQREQHRLFRISNEARKAFISVGGMNLVKNGRKHTRRHYHIISPEEKDEIRRQTVSFISPIMGFFGGWWPTIFWIILGFTLGKLLSNCGARVVISYREKGCGPWLIWSLWGTLFAIFALPKAMLQSLNNKIDEAVQGFNDKQDKIDAMLKEGKNDWTVGMPLTIPGFHKRVTREVPENNPPNSRRADSPLSDWENEFPARISRNSRRSRSSPGGRPFYNANDRPTW